ncbi:unnamed protein product [Porites lobata]|uniref:Uncharacterized protein n=1 Tax=Porites lobata TaxID=104759 RepID=A0ABN8NIB7_9CNID|nr:unnamed protein product [Porites lobata]
MGQVYSSYKMKKREKADRKKWQREQLKKEAECIVRLQEEQQRLTEILEEHYVYQPDLRPEPRDGKECKTIEMTEEVEALERKLFLEETALDVTDERCNFLDRNLSLLQQNQLDLEYERPSRQKNLAALRIKHEACQFNLYQKANPIEQWTVKSLPNLWFTSF